MGKARRASTTRKSTSGARTSASAARASAAPRASRTNAPRKAARKATLASLGAQLRREIGESDEACWRAGRVFDEIARSGKYLDAGFEDLETYADARFPGTGYSTLKRYRRVATRFSIAEVKRYTLTKLALLLSYLETLAPRYRKTKLSRLRIAHPDGRSILFADIDTATLEAVVGARTHDPGEKTVRETARLPRGGTALLERATAVLRDLQRDTVPQPALSARVVRDEKRHAVVLFTITDVEGEILARIVDAVARRKR